MAERFKVGQAPWDQQAAPSKFKVGQAPWELAETKKPSSGVGPAQTALEAFGDVATFGYLPQLQAAAEKVTTPIFEKLTGQDVPESTYVAERDAARKRMELAQQANPRAAMLGTGAGIVTSALATPGPSMAKGLLGAAQRGALTGAAYGAIQNPGDVVGEVSPLQLEERAAGAKRGALLGGAIAAGAKGGEKLFGAIKKSPKALSEAAEAQAVRQSGAMLKDFRVLNGKKQTQKLGRWLLDNGLVKAGDSFDDVARKAAEKVKSAGDELDDIYGTISQRAQENIGKQSPKVQQELARKWAKSGFNPARDRNKILEQVKRELGQEVGAGSGVKAVDDYLTQLIDDLGDQTLSPKRANEIKSAIDRKINYARNPLTKEPITEAAFRKLRSIISKKIDDDIALMGKAAGSPNELARLKAANQNYGFGKQVVGFAEDRINRESANRIYGLTEQIGAGAGGLLGAGAGALAGGDVTSGTVGGLAGAALLSAAAHGGRKYGPGLLAGGLNTAAKAAQRGGLGKIGATGERILAKPAVQRGLIRAGVDE